MLSLSLSYYVCLSLGLLYPTYASFKAIETHALDDDKQWLTYWVVYTVISSIESLAAFLVGWIPMYYEVKLMVLVWMIHPQTKGALVMYTTLIKPLLTKHASKIDPIFSRTDAVLTSNYMGYAAQLVEKYGPDVAKKAMDMAMEKANDVAETIKKNASSGGTKAD